MLRKTRTQSSAPTCRYSPDERSSGCASPSEKRRPTLSHQHSAGSVRNRGGPALPGKVSELSQHDSKMSSECSSDETVIYVVKPSPTAANDAPAIKQPSHNTDEDEDGEQSEPEKALPKIYSAVNSVSSQDSGINLSFQDSDRSADGSSAAELGRSSSAESTASSGCRRQARLSGSCLPLCKQSRATANDDLSEDDEIFFSAAAQQQASTSGTEEQRPQPSGLWHCPPKNIWKPTVEAMQEFEMVRDGDRVLLCLAGPSSLTLLHTLHQYRFYARSKGVDFEIGAASVADRDPRPAADYFKELAVPYFHEEAGKAPRLELEDGHKLAGSCTSFGEKATRAKLYALAKGNGYNVLALGQNLDDLTEGFLGSVFNNGKLRTMKAHYHIREQALRVIRPFVYVREKALRQFMESKKLPILRDLPAAPEETVQVTVRPIESEIDKNV